jgi:hypothetical protein
MISIETLLILFVSVITPYVAAATWSWLSEGRKQN